MDDAFENWLSEREKEASSDDGSMLSTGQLPACREGDVVGKWKILVRLGKGGFAEVYRVENVNDKQIGALKILCSVEEKGVKRFLRERDFLQRQNHSCFARYYDSGIKDGKPYFVVEELQPFDLPHADPEITRFLVSVCDAVADLHAEGYVHRDLKPSNIMRRQNGTYVLIDLGLIKELDRGDVPNLQKESLSIVDGQRVCAGTPGFSAPEQFVSGNASVSSDIYAIGMLVNACFNGSPPPNWSKVVGFATCGIELRRYQSVSELKDAIIAASSIRPKIVIAAEVLCFPMFLLVAALNVFALLFASDLDGGILAPILFTAWQCAVCIALHKRKNWARRYIIFVGVLVLLSILTSFAAPFPKGAGFSLGSVDSLIKGFLLITRTIPAFMLLRPDARRWFKAATMEKPI